MPHNSGMPSALDRFSPAARSWFAEAFAAPTQAQELGWEAIAEREHTLLLAPTGSGKTLAAFLWCLDQLVVQPVGERTVLDRRGRRKRLGTTVLYVSPLKALSYDVQRNLRAPLAGLRIAALRAGLTEPDITVAIRTGDTSPAEREQIRRDPPDILITTPESLFLMLTSRSRETMRTVRTVIVDEIHTMAGTKRGAHLALSLERLEHLAGHPVQRIGLSATQRPLDLIAKYLGGDRPVRIADAGASKELDLKVIVPVDDMEHPGSAGHAQAPRGINGTGYEGGSSLWPAIYPQILELVRAHRSTLIFVNNRRLAERIALRINEIAGEELLRAHHGSVSREQRLEIEDRLKAGLIPGLVCTSSLELGIDMGAVDLVIQIESPKSVARGLQRVGRAGHQVGAPSVGRIFPKFRGDLLECAVVTQRMRQGLIEATVIPMNPIDVLAQQVVAMCAMDDWKVAEIEALVRRAHSFSGLSGEALESVLGMLAGHYPSDEFADLRPRVIWDPETNIVSGRRDARALAVVNAGTIPDRGLYGVFLGEDGPRVGELDEEMVYESRAGETFLLGATTWRIEMITRDRVIVSPAPGEPGKMPFWKGDGIGRPLEFGRAIGAFTREISALAQRDRPRALIQLVTEHDLDDRAAENLLAYLDDEREATGALPTDRCIVIERFRDELGDWRVVILTPFGGRVHAPWGQAIEAKLAQRGGFDIQTLWSDDGIAVRFAGGEEPPPTAELLPSPEEVEELVISRLADTPLFAAHFRENAGRALLLPKRRPGARSPLWLQRQRSANLLAVASRYGSFPIILETYRECLRDVFDMPGLVEVLGQIRSREIRVVESETNDASPFARSLLFDYIAAYMYEGDAPLAERRAQALTLDRNLLNDLLGEAELRELLDPDALETLELELQCVADGRRARNVDHAHDLLRRLGDLSENEVAARCDPPTSARDWLQELLASRRACPVRLGGELRWIPMEDAGRYRDGLGVSPPLGVPEAYLQPSTGALEGLLRRYARTHVPFLAAHVGERWTLPEAVVLVTLQTLDRAGTILHGDFRRGGREREWCDPDVLRQLRRRSLARLRREVEPVDHRTYARFLLRWHAIGTDLGGAHRLRQALVHLEGYPIAASVLERDVLPLRLPGYQPRMLDELGASGELAWAGAGGIAKDDGKVVLFRRERMPDLLRAPAAPPEGLGAAVLDTLRQRGAQFFAELVRVAAAPPRDVLEALWELVWAGFATNDTLAPVRALAWPKRGTPSPRRAGSLVPPDASGRWSAVPVGPVEGATHTSKAHAIAEMLLERYGVVTREAVNTEGVVGGFAAVYPVFKAMEEAGRVRRGYFIDGFGAAQFALPGAVDRLRAEREAREDSEVRILAATDPANPWGAALPYPRRDSEDRRMLARVAGAKVVLLDGLPVVYLDRGGHGLVTLPEWDVEASAALACRALIAGADPGGRPLAFERVDGEPAAQSPRSRPLIDAGFAPGYKGLSYRPPRGAANARGR